jgi:hypothetical protein
LQTGCAVVESSAQHNTDDTLAITQRCRPEQRIDGRPRMMFFRTRRQTQTTSLDQQVSIGRSHVDVTGFNRLAIDRVSDWIWATRLQQRGQQASMSADVEDDEHRRGKLARQPFD